MYKIRVNNKSEYQIELTGLSKGKLNGKDTAWDILEIKDGSFHAIKDYKSYTIELHKVDLAEKALVISVNGNKYSVSVKDKYDELLHELGLDNLVNAKVKEVKAPMPGLVLEVRVNEGSAVKKGDALVVLEAMKMENILKSPADGTVKKINVKKGMAVEKNQILIHFT